MKKEEKKVETTDSGVVSKSKGYKEFEALIAKYKVQNPVKYEQKKEALKAQLLAKK